VENPGVYQSKWGEILLRTVHAYPPGSPGLVPALEALCMSAEREGEAKGRMKTALDVCDGIHDGPPAGIKCLSCYHVEVGFQEEEKVLAEIAAANRRAALEDEINR